MLFVPERGGRRQEESGRAAFQGGELEPRTFEQRVTVDLAGQAVLRTHIARRTRYYFLTVL